MTQAVPLHLAVDLGAGSGRVMLGRISSAGVALREAHRFHYGPRRAGAHQRWDFDALLQGIRDGIARSHGAAAELGGVPASIGVDSWGVDYGLIDAEGRLIEDPVSYRDERTAGVMEEVCAQLGREDIFGRTGIQFLPFNTLYQLVAHVREGLPPRAARLLMIPDLCHHALCGSTSGEHTNASTTQLLGLDGQGWDESLFTRLGLPRALMPEVKEAGATLGTLRPEWRSGKGLPEMKVVAPATHDTGSAVLGTPLNPGWAYISSGTWSLVGVERSAPLVNAASARANFTNEGGAFGTVRFLKNVMGLWLLEGCRKEWEAQGLFKDYTELLAAVEGVSGFPGFVFPDDPRFFSPASMTTAIKAALAETGQGPIEDPVLLAKVILDSLALRYASVIGIIEGLTGEAIAGVHIVGGGSLNAYLNQATANAASRPVMAGPVEATALGNILAQAIGCGEIASLEEGRALLRKGVSPVRFEPREPSAWAEAAARYREMEGRILSTQRL